MKTTEARKTMVKVVAMAAVMGVTCAVRVLGSYYADWPVTEGNPIERWRTQTKGTSSWVTAPGVAWSRTDGVAASVLQNSRCSDYDLNGDGVKDIVYLCSETIYALDGKDDKVIWTAPGFLIQGLIVEDLNGDGVPEVVGFPLRNRGRVLRGTDGQTLCEFEVSSLPDYASMFTPVVSDVDGDGVKEILGNKRIVYLARNLASVRDSIVITASMMQVQGYWVSDLDADGAKEIVGVAYEPTVGQGFVANCRGEVVGLSGSEFGTKCYRRICGGADFDGDGYDDVWMYVSPFTGGGSRQSEVLLYNYAKRQQIGLITKMVPAEQENSATDMLYCCVGDVNFDGRNELVMRYIYRATGTVTGVLIGVNGEVFMGREANAGWVCDVTGDGVGDLVMADSVGTRVVDGATGQDTVYTNMTLFSTEESTGRQSGDVYRGGVGRGRYGAYRDFDGDGEYEVALYNNVTQKAYVLGGGGLREVVGYAPLSLTPGYYESAELVHLGNGKWRIVSAEGGWLKIGDERGGRLGRPLLRGKALTMFVGEAYGAMRIGTKTLRRDGDGNLYVASNGTLIGWGPVPMESHCWARNYGTPSQYWERIEYIDQVVTNIGGRETRDLRMVKRYANGRVYTGEVARYWIDTSNRPYVALEDLDGDGELEILYTSLDTNYVYSGNIVAGVPQNDTTLVFRVVNGANLETLREVRFAPSPELRYTYTYWPANLGGINVMDIDGDGGQDVVVHDYSRTYNGAWMENCYALTGGISKLAFAWRARTTMHNVGMPMGKARLESNGGMYLVGQQGGCRPYILPSGSGRVFSQFGWFIMRRENRSYGCIVPYGSFQRVISVNPENYDGDVFCFTNATAEDVNQAVWRVNIAGSDNAIGGDVHPAPGYEVLVSTIYGELYCLRVEDGTELWRMKFPVGIYDMVLGNCDADAENELVVSFMDGTVSMYDRAQTADLEVRAEELVLSEPTPGVYNNYYFTAKVYNRGGTNSGPFVVRFDDSLSAFRPQFYDPMGYEKDYSEVLVSDIPAGGVVVVTSLYDQATVAAGSELYWRPQDGEATHVITVRADSSNVVVEAQEGNNVASNGWYVYGYPDFAAVKVWSEPRQNALGTTNYVVGGPGLTNVIKVLVANVNPNGLPAYVTARVRYDVRSGSAPNILVVGDVIGEKAMQVYSGGTTEYSFAWVAPAGVARTQVYVSVNISTNVLGQERLNPRSSHEDAFLRESGVGNPYLNNRLMAQEMVIVADSDGDGIPDWYELLYPGVLSTNNPADAELDSDGDGLINREEFVYGTNPQNRDTDGDAVGQFANDSYEVKVSGTDPRNWDTDGGGAGDGIELYYSWAYTYQDPFNPLDDKNVQAPVFQYVDLKPSKVLATNVGTRVFLRAGVMPGGAAFPLMESGVFARIDLGPGGGVVVTQQLAVEWKVGGAYGVAGVYTGTLEVGGPWPTGTYVVTAEAYAEGWPLRGQATENWYVRPTNAIVVKVTTPNDGDPIRTNVLIIGVAGSADGGAGTLMSVYNPARGFVTNVANNGFNTWIAGSVPLAEGNQTITALGSNTVVGAVDRDWLEVDVNTNPPTLTIASPANMTLVASASVGVTGTVGITLMLAPNTLLWTNLTSGASGAIGIAATWGTSVPLVEGTNVIQVSARDLYGNVTVREVTVVRDMTAPATPVITYPLVVPAGTTREHFTNVLITTVSGTKEEWSWARNAGSTVQIAQVYSGTTWSLGTNYTANGRYVFTISAVDDAGNVSAGVTVYSNVYDTVLPLFNVSGPAVFTTTVSTVTFSGSASDALSGIGYLQSVLNGSTVSNYPAVGSWSAGVAGLTQGWNTVVWRLFDRAGNVSNRTVMVYVDLTDPTVVITNLFGGSAYTTVVANVAFGGYAFDLQSGISNWVVCSNLVLGARRDLPVVNGAWGTNAMPLAAGTNTLQVIASDRAGRRAFARQTVYYDNADPFAVITNPAATTTVIVPTAMVGGWAYDWDGGAYWSAGYGVTLSNVTTGAAWVFGGTWKGTNHFGATFDLVPGSNVFVAVAWDNAGRSSTSAERVIVYDAPAIMITNPPTAMANVPYEVSAVPVVAIHNGIVGAIGVIIGNGATNWQPVANPFTYPVALDIGATTVTLVGTNAAGVWASDSVTITRAAGVEGSPAIVITNPAEANVVVPHEVSVVPVVATNDGIVGGIAVRMNGGTPVWYELANPFTYKVALNVGVTTVTLEGTNAAGVWASDSVTITRAAGVEGSPAIVITNPVDANVVVPHEVSVVPVVATNDGIVGGIAVRINGGAPVWYEVANPFTYNVALDVGATTVTLEGTNAAGVWASDSVTITRLPGSDGAPAIVITNPVDANVIVPHEVSVVPVVATNDGIVGGIAVRINGGTPVWYELANPFTYNVALGVGVTTVTLEGTNAAGVVASDSVTITRLPGGDGAPAIVITNPPAANVVVPHEVSFVPVVATNDGIVGSIAVRINGGAPVWYELANPFTYNVALDVGVTTVTLEGTNAAGVWASDSVTITREAGGDGAPSIVITNPPAANVVVPHEVSFMPVVATNDGIVGGIAVRINGGTPVWHELANPFTYNVALDVGVTTVTLEGTNAAGVWASDSVTITRAAGVEGSPAIVITNPPAANVVVPHEVSVVPVVATNDGIVGGIAVRINGGAPVWYEVANPFTYNVALDVGATTITLEGTNAAGVWASDSVTITREAGVEGSPAIVITNPPEANVVVPYNTLALPIVATNDGVVEVIGVRINGGTPTWYPVANPFTYNAVLDVGVTTITLEGTNAVGVWASDSVTITRESRAPAVLGWRIVLSNDNQRTILSWSNAPVATILAQTDQYYAAEGPWFELAVGVTSPWVHEDASNYWAVFYRAVNGNATSAYDVGKMSITVPGGGGYSYVSSPFEVEGERSVSNLFGTQLTAGTLATADQVLGQEFGGGGVLLLARYRTGLTNYWQYVLPSYATNVPVCHGLVVRTAKETTITFTGVVPTNKVVEARTLAGDDQYTLLNLPWCAPVAISNLFGTYLTPGTVASGDQYLLQDTLGGAVLLGARYRSGEPNYWQYLLPSATNAWPMRVFYVRASRETNLVFTINE